MISLQENDYGFFQVFPTPSQAELEEYYSKRYYQAPTVATYSKHYNEEELRLTKIAAEVADIVVKNNSLNSEPTLFDIGCGEGFFMSFLEQLGWSVFGTDYSEAGIQAQNPHLFSKVTYGNAELDLNQRILEGQKFKLVNLGNILEHVTDPISFIRTIKQLIDKDGVLRIVVPNDTSEFQGLLKSLGKSKDEWYCAPDHLSYFNFKSLINFVTKEGFSVIDSFGDFPIEMFLMNDFSNYYNIKESGPQAHLARVKIMNFVRDQGLDVYLEWSKALAKTKLSRSCIIYCKIS
ncbi:class I SAM-dependent methyltransferase [Aquirufa sp. WAEICH-18A]|uniref:Class I SAM-dependent methyltransferase n=2 Tax=Aquirufa aurantiipilula TaxID=2696561 RepID=A0ABT6BK54_9BACT|nr:class I SAM-dependent methyltransferase [Aquirufa aurantiipilula]